MNPSTTATAVDQLACSFDQLLGQHGDCRLDVLEVLVERRRRRPGLPRDVDHLDRPPRGGHQQLRGALEQPLTCRPPPAPGDAAVRRGNELRVIGDGHGRPWYRAVSYTHL